VLAKEKAKEAVDTINEKIHELKAKPEAKARPPRRSRRS
jgi:hypothetical protein